MVDVLAEQAMTKKGFELTDTILRAAIRHQVALTLKRLHRGGTVGNVGTRREPKWKLGDS
jgi:hypothetical protein